MGLWPGIQRKWQLLSTRLQIRTALAAAKDSPRIDYLGRGGFDDGYHISTAETKRGRGSGCRVGN